MRMQMLYFLSVLSMACMTGATSNAPTITDLDNLRHRLAAFTCSNSDREDVSDFVRLALEAVQVDKTAFSHSELYRAYHLCDKKMEAAIKKFDERDISTLRRALKDTEDGFQGQDVKQDISRKKDHREQRSR